MVLSIIGLVFGIARLVAPGSVLANPQHLDQINKMAQHLNDKYGYDLSADECFYFREEDYSWHGDLLGFGKTYNIPYIAAFRVDGEEIVVADRKGIISDNAQLDEISDLLCRYYGEKLDLNIEYIAIRTAGNGNTVDHTINHILQYSFPQKITAENVEQFMDCVWQQKRVELTFYFCESADVQSQVEEITAKLKSIAAEHENLVRLEFYIRKADAPLDLCFAQPDLNTEYLQHNTSKDHNDDYKFGAYYVADHYYDLVDFYVRAGICQLGRSQDGGLGSYEKTNVNGWQVAVFHRLSHYERNGVNQREIDHYHAVFGKVYEDAAIDDDFSPGVVRIVVYPFALKFDYAPEDFADIGCIAVEDISDWAQGTHPSRILELTLQEQSKKAVLDAIAWLMKHDDVYFAEPVYAEDQKVGSKHLIPPVDRGYLNYIYEGAGPMDDEDTVSGMQYYGIFGGYMIFMDAGDLDAISEVSIGDRTFRWGSSPLKLVAYKDLTPYDLGVLYDSGDITDEILDAILKRHKEYFATMHNWNHDTT